jgi:hypothetical protein
MSVLVALAGLIATFLTFQQSLTGPAIFIPPLVIVGIFLISLAFGVLGLTRSRNRIARVFSFVLIVSIFLFVLYKFGLILLIAWMFRGYSPTGH